MTCIPSCYFLLEKDLFVVAVVIPLKKGIQIHSNWIPLSLE